MDKTKGAGNGIAGGVGEAAGSPRLQTEGAAQELKGTVAEQGRRGERRRARSDEGNPQGG